MDEEDDLSVGPSGDSASRPRGREQRVLSVRLAELSARHAAVAAEQEALGRRLSVLEGELRRLRQDASAEVGPSVAPPVVGAEASPPPRPTDSRVVDHEARPPRRPAATQRAGASAVSSRRRSSAALEGWVGEHLLALVGIGILLLGLGVGIRYAIENDWISPTLRIVAAYVLGAALVAAAEVLRTRGYDRLAPVLVGGGAAALYFTTYVAVDLYDLVPRAPAFAVMASLTAFTVLAALRYDRQVVAFLGIVGAYAVPFLVSGDGGSATGLLTYVGFVNLGVVAVGYSRPWRPLVTVASGLTWVVFAAAVAGVGVGAATRLGFAGLYAATFYAAALARAVWLGRRVSAADVVLVAANGLLFYAVGYEALERLERDAYLGAFTLACAAVHLGLGVALRRRAGASRGLVPTLAALSLAFVAVAVPVQLDGSPVTAAWAALALVLAYLSSRSASAPRHLRYPAAALYLLACASLAGDYAFQPLASGGGFTPILNRVFLVGLFAVASVAGGAYFARARRPGGWRSLVARPGLASLTVAAGFALGLAEIDAYWLSLEMSFDASGFGEPVDLLTADRQRGRLATAWRIAYALAFAAIAGSAWLKFGSAARWPAVAFAVGVAVAIAAYLTQGLYVLSELREHAMVAPGGRASWHPGLRYVSLGLAGLAAVVLRGLLRSVRASPGLWRVGELAACAGVLWVATAELLHALDLAGARDQYKLSVSLLWGGYALALVTAGLLRGRAHVRGAGVALFAATLLKLFAYDLSALSTIAKTTVLVALGMLLLVASFAYTKYKPRLGAGDDH